MAPSTCVDSETPALVIVLMQWGTIVSAVARANRRIQDQDAADNERKAAFESVV
jgi:hypothetical protein